MIRVDPLRSALARWIDHGNSLLSPLGVYRDTYLNPSKGKRQRAKRKHDELAQATPQTKTPPRPELAGYIDVGLSCISRQLELLSGRHENNPSSEKQPESKSSSTNETPQQQYAVIFVSRSGLAPAFIAHFPQMVAAASSPNANEDSARLVGFSRSCQERLSSCLGIPRVSSVAIRTGAPQSKALVDFVRAHVPSIEVTWLEEALAADHLQTNINAVTTSIGPQKKVPLQRSD